jgi:rubrerythrin
MIYYYDADKGNSPARQPKPAAAPVMAETPVQSGDVFTYPQNLPGALVLMQQAVAGESEDRLFYSWLIDQAPSNEDKKIITGIRDNEISHFGYFRQLYAELTGKEMPPVQGEKFIPPAGYCEGLARALQGEQNAVQKYRKILFAMQNRVHINILTEIITDEIRHGILYNYLYTKNDCKGV